MLIAYEVAKDMVRKLAPIVAKIQRHDASQADQLRRAASSVVLNLGEGARSLKGNKAKHYWIAHGSAGEVRACLEVAMAWGWIDRAHEAEAVVDHVLRLVWGLTHPK